MVRGALRTDDPRLAGMGEQERAFGDYGPGRWAWVLEGALPLERPVEAAGKLGIWRWYQEAA